ncbi:recombinase family protein [Jannaschia sp. KMU-145]|uniref:recombinase family protein n=1 Tax=Jannaschia halovivens TaxID=3388667 RepID=UPI00396B3036
MKIVAYMRVSTQRQGASGLGLEAQRAAIESYAKSVGASADFREFVEVESGKDNDRPQLAAAIREARLTGATLVIARLNRLSRNAAFLLTLRDAGVDFVAADMPHANNLTVGIMALVAQEERESIARSTRAALAAAKARGTRLGNPNGADALRRAAKGNRDAVKAIRKKADAFAHDLVPTLAEIGPGPLAHIAAELNRRGIRTARGGTWHPATVANVQRRLSQ